MLVEGFITVKSDNKPADKQRVSRLQDRGCVDLGKEVTEAKVILCLCSLLPWLQDLEENAPPKKDGFCLMGEQLSTAVMVAVPSALSPEPQIPVSLHTT